MVVGSRWSMLDRHKVRNVVAVGSLVALAAALSACGVSSETSTERLSGDEATPTASSGTGGGDTSDAASVCTPYLGGLTLATLAPVKIQCPSGYGLRDSSKALPVAGRFTNDDELVKAYCVTLSSSSSPAAPPSAPTTNPPKLSLGPNVIDFESNDVVAYAYDANAGAPSLYRRSTELWLRTLSDSCTGSAPTLASVAFVIPKHTEVNEQTCSRSCR